MVTLQEKFYHICLTNDGNELQRLNHMLMITQLKNGRISRTHSYLIPISLFLITFRIVQIFKHKFIFTESDIHVLGAGGKGLL